MDGTGQGTQRVLSIVDRVGMNRGVVEAAVDAVRGQLWMDVRPVWPTNLRLEVDAVHADAWLELVASAPVDTGETHGRTGSTAWVAVGGRRDLGVWTRELSHEVLGLAVPQPVAGVSTHICGPVARMAYVVRGILVAGFVLPGWFGRGGPTMFPG